MKMMKKKIEIEQHPNAFVGVNGRTSARYSVIGYVAEEGQGWTGVRLTEGGEHMFVRTDAMRIANQFMGTSEDAARMLVFGQVV